MGRRSNVFKSRPGGNCNEGILHAHSIFRIGTPLPDAESNILVFIDNEVD